MTAITQIDLLGSLRRRCLRQQDATGNILLGHFGATFKRRQCACSTVGDDVATETIHIQLATQRCADADRRRSEPGRDVAEPPHALLQGLLA